MFLVREPVSFELVAVGVEHFAEAFAEVVFELALVDVVVVVGQHALPVAQAAQPFALVTVFVRILAETRAFFFTVYPVPVVPKESFCCGRGNIRGIYEAGFKREGIMRGFCWKII